MWTLSGFADEISPEPSVQCEVLTGLGISHIEVRSAWNTNVLDLDDEQLAAVTAQLRDSDIRTSSIGSPIGKVSVVDDFDEHLRRFDRALRVAEVLEAPYIRIFSFYYPDGDEPKQHRDEVLRRLSTLAERAAGRDVILLHENEKKIYGDLPERCLDIIESVGSPNLKIAWDAANFVQCGISPFPEAFNLLRPHLEYVQIKDALLADNRVVVAGAGDGGVVETIRALKADGFDGFFSMEPHLSTAGPAGGFSGPDLFQQATTAFTNILDQEDIPYR
ncbi:sugar phosphate isomerase/epimerase [Kribbella pittospori]|uniref:Sugar phosphate isomerase/epimerase n=1 Tax=Kribbella pittospori TaxID=722689 RepID=A0A4R0KRD5_9ACTN|nr:sugar phosphate isomerase/epimerase family protein [Kribbella pittospori]TCC63421.1 sugar phosphate isomerase/epimerase [Kribbella pittospori]